MRGRNGRLVLLRDGEAGVLCRRVNEVVMGSLRSRMMKAVAI